MPPRSSKNECCKYDVDQITKQAMRMCLSGSSCSLIFIHVKDSITNWRDENTSLGKQDRERKAIATTIHQVFKPSCQACIPFPALVQNISDGNLSKDVKTTCDIWDLSFVTSCHQVVTFLWKKNPCRKVLWLQQNHHQHPNTRIISEKSPTVGLFHSPLS